MIGEEVIQMNEDIQRAFDKLEKAVEDNGRETRDEISGLHRTFERHVGDDRVFQSEVNGFMVAEKEKKKFRALLWIAVIGAVGGSLALVVMEYIQHHVH